MSDAWDSMKNLNPSGETPGKKGGTLREKIDAAVAQERQRRKERSKKSNKPKIDHLLKVRWGISICSVLLGLCLALQPMHSYGFVSPNYMGNEHYTGFILLVFGLWQLGALLGRQKRD